MRWLGLAAALLVMLGLACLAERGIYVACCTPGGFQTTPIPR